MAGRLAALRLALWRICLLGCLIGAQHVSLVHAFEHLPSSAVALAPDDDGGGPAHSGVCPDCLSTQSLSAMSVAVAHGMVVPGLAHVLRASTPRATRHGAAPEPCAHGPPALSLI